MSNTQYTSNSNFCPKPVAELITTKYHFVIPSYQRGYRWEEKQVIDLLEDICEFAKQDKEDSEARWENKVETLSKRIETMDLKINENNRLITELKTMKCTDLICQNRKQ